MFIPILIGAAAFLGLMLISTDVEKKLEAVTPSRRRKGGYVPVVAFTGKEVFWKKSKKTGKNLTRTEIVERPKDLLAKVSEKLGREISMSAFLLASMMASEAGDGPDIAKVAIAHAALTKAKGEKNLPKILIPDGKLGSQQGRGHYASTARPPSAVDIEIAEAVLDGLYENPTPGATNFYSPNGMDAAAKRGIPGYEIPEGGMSASEFLENKWRTKYKLTDLDLPGVSPRYLRMWKPAA